MGAMLVHPWDRCLGIEIIPALCQVWSCAGNVVRDVIHHDLFRFMSCVHVFVSCGNVIITSVQASIDILSRFLSSRSSFSFPIPSIGQQGTHPADPIVIEYRNHDFRCIDWSDADVVFANRSVIQFDSVRCGADGNLCSISWEDEWKL